MFDFDNILVWAIALVGIVAIGCFTYDDTANDRLVAAATTCYGKVLVSSFNNPDRKLDALKICVLIDQSNAVGLVKNG